jgi:hypothetical protein
VYRHISDFVLLLPYIAGRVSCKFRRFGLYPPHLREFLLQARFPDKKFQILLPYENWKPVRWTPGEEELNLFSLLDHYDEAQLQSDYFDRFIIYVRDNPPTY